MTDLSGGSEQMRWALETAAACKMAHREFRVLIALLTYRNRKTGTAWPSAGTLAELTGMSVSAVERALRTLRTLGVIEQAGRRKAGNGLSTIEYRFVTSQVRAEVPAPEVQAEVPGPSPQVRAEVPGAGSQVRAEVPAPGEPGPGTSAVQVQAEVTDKPLEEPPTTPPLPVVDEWLGDTMTWTPRYNPSNESKRKMLRLYPELTVEDQMMLADKAAGRVIETRDPRGMSDVLFEAYCRTEANDRRKKKAEAEAAEAMDVETYFGWDRAEAERRWNETRGITTT